MNRIRRCVGRSAQTAFFAAAVLTSFQAEASSRAQNGGEVIGRDGAAPIFLPVGPVLEAKKVAASMDEEVDSHGNDRKWWRERVQGWENKKAEANSKLTQAREELAKSQLPNYIGIQKRLELNEQIEQYQNELREAEEMLNVTLPEEARKAGAPPGWLR